MVADYLNDETTMKILIVLLLAALNASALATDKLDWYECSTEEQLRSCNKCKKTGVVSLLADKNNNFVLMQLDSGETQEIENCRIFDSKNWSCSSNSSDASNILITQYAMISGVFRYKFHGEKIGNKPLLIRHCAK